jgi:hypothetical protein
MKIGTSYSRCVRDIVTGKVSFDDVVVIVARTDFDPENDTQWQGIWHGYAGDRTLGSIWSHPEWYEYSEREQEFRDMSIKLKKAGKLHQPRQFGAFPPRMNEYWYDLVLTSTVQESNPAAKEAWDNYKIVSKLTAPSKHTEVDNDF